MKQYDVILIGTGQATGTIIPELLKLNLKIAIVESDKTGGTCVNWGCTPTKTLIASARDAHMVRRSSDFGVHVSSFQIDFKKIMERVNNIRVPNSQGFESWLKSIGDFYSGEASFIDDHTISIGDDKIFGDSIVIHSGTRSRVPQIKGINETSWLDNKGILALENLPEHLMVVGASYIGLEFAQAFKRLGSKVTVIGRGPRIVPREDEDLSAIALDILEKENIEFFLNSNLMAMEEVNNSLKVEFEQEGVKKELFGSHLLLAVGRIPNTDMLNLNSAGVELDERGYIKVNDSGQTNIHHIFALGDVNGKGAFTHTSVHDGQVFIDFLNGGPKRISHRIPIHSMFIDPPLARVGMNESELQKSGVHVLVATKEMKTISRAKEKDEIDGVIKVFVNKKNGLILGATIFGVGGDEVIGMLALAMQAELPFTKIQETVLPHPTVSELIPWVFNDLKILNK